MSDPQKVFTRGVLKALQNVIRSWISVEMIANKQAPDLSTIEAYKRVHNHIEDIIKHIEGK